MKVFIEEIQDYDFQRIYSFLKESTESIDLWEKLKTKKTILIKPNLLGPYKPEKAITTHPIILEALICLLKEKGKKIWIGDSPGGSIKVNRVWEETGIIKIVEKHKIKLLNFSEGGIVTRTSPNHTFTTSKYFWEADAVINVGKYKTHSLTYYTGAIKNIYGIIPGLRKSDYHRDNADNTKFSTVISELYNTAKENIVFNILDGIWGMEGDGPSAGIPRNFGVLFAGESASAIDKIASKMMGFNLNQLPYVKSSLQNEHISFKDIEFPEKWNNFVFKNVKLKKISLFIKIFTKSPKFFRKIFKNLFEYFPDFNDKCTLCNICVDSCPVKAISLEKKNNKLKIDYLKCIKCMCCHELCPHHAVYIRKSFLAKFIIK